MAKTPTNVNKLITHFISQSASIFNALIILKLTRLNAFTGSCFLNKTAVRGALW